MAIEKGEMIISTKDPVYLGVLSYEHANAAVECKDCNFTVNNEYYDKYTLLYSDSSCLDVIQRYFKKVWSKAVNHCLHNNHRVNLILICPEGPNAIWSISRSDLNHYCKKG